MFKHDSSITKPIENISRMRCQDHDTCTLKQICHSFLSLRLKVGVTGAKHFIDNKHLRLNSGSNSKEQPGHHTSGIRSYRYVEEVPKLGEIFHIWDQSFRLCEGGSEKHRHPANIFIS